VEGCEGLGRAFWRGVDGMCVVSIAWRAHPEWQLVVAGNRDEYHARASAPLAHWDDEPAILAGRDLVSGGTWIGVSEAGRFSVVTNIRNADGPDPDKLSRGALVGNWLRRAELPQRLDQFNPFNLIVAGPHGLRYLANRPMAINDALPTGIHGLSNAVANEHWPRKDRLNNVMASWLQGSSHSLDALLDALTDQHLPDRDSHPIFISSPVYGTRCSTVVAVDNEGRGQIVERTFYAAGLPIGDRRLSFTWHN
jgi:uncharacterized protein with NRDE domain